MTSNATRPGTIAGGDGCGASRGRSRRRLRPEPADQRPWRRSRIGCQPLQRPHLLQLDGPLLAARAVKKRQYSRFLPIVGPVADPPQPHPAEAAHQPTSHNQRRAIMKVIVTAAVLMGVGGMLSPAFAGGVGAKKPSAI